MTSVLRNSCHSHAIGHADFARIFPSAAASLGDAAMQRCDPRKSDQIERRARRREQPGNSRCGQSASFKAGRNAPAVANRRRNRSRYPRGGIRGCSSPPGIILRGDYGDPGILNRSQRLKQSRLTGSRSAGSDEGRGLASWEPIDLADPRNHRSVDR